MFKTQRFHALGVSLTTAMLLAGCGDDTATSTESGSSTDSAETETTGDDTMSTSTTEDMTAGPGSESETSPTTEDPTTEDPTTENPTTEDPTTEDPTTEDPTTGEPAVCGDGVVEGDEACDDGNDIETDECLSTCELASCGDGNIQEGVEDCDDGNDDDSDECPSSCLAASCGDGFVWEGMEECDAGGEAADCDDDCTVVECGDGNVNEEAGEACDDMNDDNSDECIDTCEAASCGDGFVWADNEQCDDGNLESGDGCSDMCESEECNLDADNLPFPATIHPSNYYGDIAWDADCNILVGGSFNDGLFRVSKDDGSVTQIVNMFGSNSVNGITYRPQDELIYVAVDSPNRLFTVDSNNMTSQVTDLPAIINDIDVIPEGFGDLGGQIMMVSASSAIYVYDPSDSSITQFAMSSGPLSALDFAPDAQTFYVANYNNNRIDAVDVDGVVTTFYMGGLSGPDGIEVDSDGARLFVAQSNANRIDIITIPGAVLTQGPTGEFDGGYYPTGLLVDADDDLFYKARVGGQAVVDTSNVP